MKSNDDFNEKALVSQRRTAAAVGVTVAKRHILLCCDQTKPKCCDSKRGLVAWEYLKRRLREGCPSRVECCAQKPTVCGCAKGALSLSCIPKGCGTGSATR